MKKLNNVNTYSIMLITAAVFIFCAVQFMNCTAQPQKKYNDEVVLVNKQLMESHPWEEAAFDITCVDSLDCESEDGYYWFIYDSPDQFETTLCVSTNRETYEKLQKLLHRMRQSNWDYNEYLNSDADRFHLYYGQCEETVLIYE